MFDPITIFLIVLCLFSVGLFLLLHLLLRQFPLALVVKQVWWYQILLTLLVRKTFDFSIKCELESCWVEYSLLQVLPFHHFKYIVLVEFLLINQLIALWKFPCMLFFFLVAFNILSWSLIFVSLITMYLYVFLLVFILPGTLCTSWTFLTISFSRIGKFSVVISSNIFSGPFSLSSPFGPYYLNVGAFNVLPEVSQAVSIPFHSFFLYSVLQQ